MSRFFKKSENIDTLTTKEIDEYLREEKIVGKVMPDRVKDFYNSLSQVLAEETVEVEETVDYEQFNCKTDEDIQKIDQLRGLEHNFVRSINKQYLTGGRLLKAAAALAFKFEKDMYGGRADVKDMDPNQYLKHLFAYHEEEKGVGEPAPFGDMLDVDVQFIKYLALLSNKKAFAKLSGKMEKDPEGKTIKHTAMESFEEIFNMDLLEVALPGYTRKLVNKDLYVKARFSKKDRSQNLIVLIDNSGSMSSSVKRGMVKAALTLKLRDHSEVHNIYIGTFVTKVNGFKKIEKGMTVEDLPFLTFDGGSTYVNKCIKETISMIKKRKLQNIEGGEYDLSDDHFEILVVNDGQDHVDRTYHPPVKIHALCLMQSNPDLKNICHRSSGTYHYLTED